MRQAGVYTEGNMLPDCRGAGSQSPWSDAGRSQKLHPTNRWPTWRATVPYRARFSWELCAWMCPAPRRHCAFVLRLKAVKTVPYRFNAARARAGARNRGVEASRLEREQMAHSSKDGNPLVDGRLTVRRMRRVDWTC